MKNGVELGRYRIDRKIGAGAMGEIYLAEDTRLDRDVALKILPEEFADDSDRMSRFILEAKAASALNHPNIITTYEIDEHDGVHFIAFEYIDGELLEDRLCRKEFTIQEVIDIAVQMASALSVAHEAGIVHRDIKPGNIMIRGDGLVKILDFGIAKLSRPEPENIDPEAETRMQVETREGHILGTASYMSPEQARGKQIDARSDLWSVGCVVYEMLTNRQPFQGETMTDVLANIIYLEPAPIRELRSDVPPGLETIIERTLSKEVDERYLDSGELVRDLKDLQTRLLVEVEKTRNQSSNTIIGDKVKPFRESIAVLPFTDISTEEDNQYFSEGLTEEINMNLSKLQQLKVVARGSVIKCLAKEPSHKELARELRVRYLLEGSVRRHGNELRITAQLIDAIGEAYVWAEAYRGTIEDVFEIQEKVAAEIVRALQVRLSPVDKKNLKKRYTKNTEAYQLYLQGRYFWNKRSEESLKIAIRHFEQAIEKDPEYAIAWAGIADSYSLLGEYGRIPRKELHPKAEEAAHNALELDEGLAEAHASRAIILMLKDWNWSESFKEFQQAIELNPNYPTAHHWLSQWYVTLGSLNEAKQSIQRAAELDPVSRAIQKDKGLTFYYDRKYDPAIEIAQTTLEFDPDYSAAHRLLSLAYQGKGMLDEAMNENRIWGELTGNELETEVSLAQLLATAGERDKAIAIVKSLEDRIPAAGNVCRGMILVYAALGENDLAFKWLEESVDRREEAVLSIKVDPKLDNIRNDPRFEENLRKIGLDGER
ncbi:MAG: hypothetical protein DWQ47_00320 [Acidobacteria bacterium]|nr:MAG: hypothetical protein DWQ32_10780 [Acidobacteriota bacterium]REK03956.1 MAG: hypothetical protein DWQ38_00305 [Acidobacteriota bacterium]REK15118.1 MAG: hypothetical protein DWQ43_16470 [Acidobacteriota bacterium]REK46208.1 MAG: hypothetical protein DWQ47_00320 [Acidobacteriota bacterium]